MVQRSHSKLATKKDLLKLATKKDLQESKLATKKEMQEIRLAAKKDLLEFRNEVNGRLSAHDSQFEMLLALIKESAVDTQRQIRESEERVTRSIHIMFGTVSEHEVTLTNHGKRIERLEKTITT